MNNIIIKRVTLADLHQLQKIGKQTFSDAFSEQNTAENLKAYLEEGFSTEKLIAELSNQHSEFYFATRNGTVIGYLKINFGPSQTDIKDEHAIEIERIYVLKEYHGKQVGQLLYEKAMQIARQRNAVYIWLGVWEENPRAISFYKKNGFVEFGRHVFKLGDDEQTDLMMKLSLNEKPE